MKSIYSAGLVSLVLLVACGGSPARREALDAQQVQRQRAMAMWKARCEKSGVFIHKTIENVEGIYLINVRRRSNFGDSHEDQFALDDPYGYDSVGDNYMKSFLRGAHPRAPDGGPPYPDAPRTGFSYVEAIDVKDGQLYRYTGLASTSPEAPTRLDLVKRPIHKRTARFGVEFRDISTREERDLWIAGSLLRVIDLDTGEVLGERIGYMVDRAQGSRTGNRSPWLGAADNACPDFLHGLPRHSPAFASQPGQTLDFVEQILKTTFIEG